MALGLRACSGILVGSVVLALAADTAAAAETAVAGQPADPPVSITVRSDDGPLTEGEDRTYETTVDNVGDTDHHDLVVTQLLPGGFRYESADPAVQGQNPVHWRVDLPAGESTDLTLTVVAGASTQVDEGQMVRVIQPEDRAGPESPGRDFTTTVCVKDGPIGPLLACSSHAGGLVTPADGLGTGGRVAAVVLLVVAVSGFAVLAERGRRRRAGPPIGSGHRMGRATLVGGYRLVGGLLIISAAVNTWIVKWDEPSFTPANFFSYFTNLSNLFAAGVLLAGVARAVQGRPPSERWALIRGAAVLYMAVTGLVYNLVLSGYDSIADVTPAYTNLVMHQLMPLVMVVDWLIEPPKVALSFRRALPAWLAFPLLYLAYSEIRGPIADWYPYPFLDPTRDGGYPRVAAASLIIAAAFVALTWGLVRVANVLRARRDHPTPRSHGRTPVASPTPA